ncbi:MAG: ADP-glyceromanno-heptose 6-epimerase [Planctomycetales bacterium]|nr:ADP-glyceromanno-heptose 6-epimerase [Planctomycetales bacterium]
MYESLDLNGKTVLVTGGAGYIGANLALRIESMYPDAKVIAFDSFRLGDYRALDGFRGQFIGGDITCPADLARLSSFRFDAIFHEAAISDTRVNDQALMLNVNTNAFRDILELAAEHRSAVVYASSAAVYGSATAPNRVGNGESPETVYGFSKLMMERVADAYAERLEGRITGLRYFNVYGPGEFYKGSTASMILQLGVQALQTGRARLYEYGGQSRDFVYIEDVIQANLRCLAREPGADRSAKVFNVGAGEARPFNDIVAALRESLGISIDIEYIPNPHSTYQVHTEADIEPIVSAVGYSPQFRLEAGVKAYTPEILRIAEQLGTPRTRAA